MPNVHVPTVLRPRVGGASTVEVPGASLREVFDAIEARHPGFGESIVEDGELRRFVNVFVDDEDVRYLDGLDTEVSAGTDVVILPAVAGGR